MEIAHIQRPEKAAIVALPTSGWDAPSYTQTVVGKQSPRSEDIQEFRGIPYGKVSARWTHSRLRTRLPRDVFDATQNGPKCPQPYGPNNSRIYQSYLPFPNDIENEFDCLNLFIIRPSPRALARLKLDSTRVKLPVLIWIHGGGYAFGSATDPMWDPTYLVLRSIHNGTPIIAVGINYRLNIFGFGASSDIISAQGNSPLKGVNFGLRDQKIALAWVSRNISAFGGDAQKVTIAGQSAGGSSVHSHLLEAELSSQRPLFRKAIIQSGAVGSLGPTSLSFADKCWEDLCKHWSVDQESGIQRVELLRRIPALDLIRTASELGWGTFPIVVDNSTVRDCTHEADVTIHLGDDDINNKIKAVDRPIQVLLGVTESEGSLWIQPTWSFEEVKSIFSRAYPSPLTADVALAAYGLSPTASSTNLHNGLIQFVTDSMIALPVYRARNFFATHRLRKMRPQDVKARRLGVQSYHIKFGNPFPGKEQNVSHHCVDLIYLFAAFHDALEKADNVITSPYTPLEEMSLEHGSGSGVGSSVAEGTPLKPPILASYGRTNIELCHDIQDRWIHFIANDNEELDGFGNADEITVFGNDRVARVESLINGPEWVDQKKRYDILEKDLASMLAVRKAIIGGVLN